MSMNGIIIVIFLLFCRENKVHMNEDVLSNSISSNLQLRNHFFVDQKTVM